jgi:hypothetical protein
MKSISNLQYIVLDTIVNKRNKIRENVPKVSTAEWWNNLFFTSLDKVWNLFGEKGKEGLKIGIKEIVERAIADKMIEIEQSEAPKTNNKVSEPPVSYQTIQNRINELEIINKELIKELAEKALKINQLQFNPIKNEKIGKSSLSKSPVRKNNIKPTDGKLFND